MNLTALQLSLPGEHLGVGQRIRAVTVDVDPSPLGQGRACLDPRPVLQLYAQLLASEAKDVFLHPALHSTIAGVTGAGTSPGEIGVLHPANATPRMRDPVTDPQRPR